MLGILTLAFLLDYQSYDQQQRSGSASYSESDPEETSVVIGSRPLRESEFETDVPKWWDKADLDAQWKMARWTTIIGIFTAGGLAILGLTLWETRKVTEETRRIGITQTQAYLVVTEIGLELARPDVMAVKRGDVVTNEFYFFYWLKIKNYGQSPAYDVSGTLNIGWQPLIQIDGTGQINRLSAGKDMCVGFGNGGPIAPHATSKIETWGMIPIAAEKLMKNAAGGLNIIGYMPYGFGDIEWINEFDRRQFSKVSVPGSARLAPLKATGNSVAPIIIQQN